MSKFFHEDAADDEADAADDDATTADDDDEDRAMTIPPRFLRKQPS